MGEAIGHLKQFLPLRRVGFGEQPVEVARGASLFKHFQFGGEPERQCVAAQQMMPHGVHRTDERQFEPACTLDPVLWAQFLFRQDALLDPPLQLSRRLARERGGKHRRGVESRHDPIRYLTADLPRLSRPGAGAYNRKVAFRQMAFGLCTRRSAAFWFLIGAIRAHSRFTPGSLQNHSSFIPILSFRRAGQTSSTCTPCPLPSL